MENAEVYVTIDLKLMKLKQDAKITKNIMVNAYHFQMFTSTEFF